MTGFTNAFGPMNQAWNRLNRTIAAGPQMKQQRLQNQLTQNKLNAYQKKQEQQANLQNALNKSENPTRAMFEYFKRTDPMKARELAKGVFDEAKQIYSYGNPEQAANYVTENLGIPVKYQGGDAYDIQIQDGNIIRMHADDQDGEEAPEMLQNGQWVPMQGNELQVQDTPGKPFEAFMRQNPNASQEEINNFIRTSEQAKYTGRTAGKGKDASSKQEEIQRYLDTGIAESRGQAVKLAEGQYKLKEGPFGVELWDLTTGEMVKRSGGGGQKETKTGGKEQMGQPLLTTEEAAEGTGPVAGIKQTLNNVVGPFIPGQLFENTESAKNKLRMFSQLIKPHLMVSSRGAIYEQQNIEQMLPTGKEFFKDPDSAKTKLQNLYTVIEGTIRSKQNLLEKGDLTEKTVKQLSEDISGLQTAKSYLPDKKSLFGDPQDQVSVDQIKRMDVDKIKALDLKKLNQEQRAALEERVDRLLNKGGELTDTMLQQYREMYPNRTDEEIRKAYSRLK